MSTSLCEFWGSTLPFIRLIGSSFLAIFADVATIAIAYDRGALWADFRYSVLTRTAPYARQPVEWQLPKVWFISTVMGEYVLYTPRIGIDSYQVSCSPPAPGSFEEPCFYPTAVSSRTLGVSRRSSSSRSRSLSLGSFVHSCCRMIFIG